MSEIVLFHHALGLTPGVTALADRFRAGGHAVHTPDLYGGRTFTVLEEGVAYARSVGMQALIDAGVAAAARLPADSVLMGISLGIGPATKAAIDRPAARAVVQVAGAGDPGWWDATWPEGTALQIHGARDDPWWQEDAEAAQMLAASVAGSQLFLYDGSAHLFMDNSTPEYDAVQTDRLVGRVLDLLSRVG